VIISRAGSSRRWLAAQGVALLLLSSAPAVAQDDEPARVFVEDEQGFYLALLVSASAYEYVLTFEIYFRGSAETVDLQTGTTAEGLPHFDSREVARIAGFGNGRAELVACVEEACLPLAGTADLEGSLEQDGEATFVRWRLGEVGDVLQKGMDLRLLADPNWVRLVSEEGSDPAPSPALSVVLPRLGEAETTVLASQPVLRVDLSPMTKDQNNEQDAASLSFEGAFRRLRRGSSLGLAYSGSVSTQKEIGFNALQVAGEYERNLLASRGDYLPLVVALGVEADQSLDLVNGLLGLSLELQMPWNANFSPRDERYIPNTGPLLKLVGQIGTRLEESEDDPMAAAAPEDFRRAGYDLRWRLPVAAATVLRIHHAGLWVFSDPPDDAFHSLWDVALESRIGNLTYFVGYQEGEAAPLFQPVETTSVGVVIRLGRQVECRADPAGGSRFVCGEP